MEMCDVVEPGGEGNREATEEGLWGGARRELTQGPGLLWDG